MIKVIAKEGALKAFYYLMSVDGVTTFEQERFREIGIELLGEAFSEAEKTIIAECENVINSIDVDDERYDLIQEGIDQALNEVVKVIEEGVVPRLLVWNMLTLAHSDSDYSENENRLINHVARILQIDKSVLAEMKQLISVAHSIQEEKEILENSTRPYAEVRHLIDEVEKRHQTIVEAAKYLIADDMIIDVTGEEEKKENVVLATGKKIGDSVIARSKKVGESMAPVAKELGAKAMTGAAGIKEGARKLFSK
ncbi:MAG: hypothetical protein J1D87_02670 [Lachnospiraceae bacterium]|nr:hypothetical protein [Lachnospiraceae bacterium]